MRKRGEHFRAVGLGHERTAGPLELAHRGVAVDADPEEIAELPRLGQVADMADVQQVEAAVGRDHLPALLAQLGAESGRLVECHDPARSSVNGPVAWPRMGPASAGSKTICNSSSMILQLLERRHQAANSRAAGLELDVARDLLRRRRRICRSSSLFIATKSSGSRPGSKRPSGSFGARYSISSFWNRVPDAGLRVVTSASWR